MFRRRATALTAAAVVASILGMVVGTGLVLATDHRSTGWLLFILSFGAWLAAALLGLREGWARGWFDR